MKQSYLEVVFRVVAVYICCFGLFVLSVTVVDYSDNYAGAEAVAVLTGGNNRIKLGIEIADALQNKIVFLSGVNKTLQSKDIHKLFQPPNSNVKINVGYQAQNTVGNASEVREWCAKNNIHHIIVVTSDYHMPRAMLEFMKYKRDIDVHFFAVKSNKLELKFFKKCFREFNRCILSCTNLKS